MTDRLTLIRPDDWHIHLRDGQALSETVDSVSRTFHRAIIMPNLVPPVLTADDAAAYKSRIVEHIPSRRQFTPLMTLYLTDKTTPAMISQAKKQADVAALKLYPAGATTHSASGVTNIEHIYPALEQMAICELPLLVHGEVTDSHIDIFDREKVFIDQHLRPLVERFPRLKVVMEHITTTDAVAFVKEAGDHVAATITAHHLLYNRNHLLVGGIKPHYYCLPVLKRNSHQEALLNAATSGDPSFFLGTDSAPHTRDAKESACGCAGCYTAPIAMELYAEAFDMMNSLDKLEGFASLFGPDFYQRPRNTETITLVRENWQMEKTIAFGDSCVIPLKAGETINWRLK